MIKRTKPQNISIRHPIRLLLSFSDDDDVDFGLNMYAQAHGARHGGWVRARVEGEGRRGGARKATDVHMWK